MPRVAAYGLASHPAAGRVQVMPSDAVIVSAAAGADLSEAVRQIELQLPALRQIPRARRAMVVGTEAGSLPDIRRFRSEIAKIGAHLVNPGLFPLTVMNAAAGLTAIEHGCEGPNITLTNGTSSALDAVAFACDLLATGRAGVVFAGAFEREGADPPAWLAALATPAIARLLSPACVVSVLVTGCASADPRDPAADHLIEAALQAAGVLPPDYLGGRILGLVSVATGEQAIGALSSMTRSLTQHAGMLATILSSSPQTDDRSVVVLASHESR